MQAAQSLEPVDGALSRLALVLVGVTGAGIVGSVLLGRAVARRAAQPVQELTAGAEYVTATQDLRRRVTAPGDDELARLARSFNTMLEALAQSRQAQRQLVADASHELRTPLTTVLANVEMLGRADALPEAEREQMRHDLVSQLHELNHLVGDLVELAREEQSEEELQDFDLGELVAECVERVRAQARDVHFVAELDFAPVRGARGRVGRAIVNLLDNARKFSPHGGEVHVTVRGREVVVRDEGPGIAPADRAHVFDRFYRAAESRALPGSGLGLAIVRQVAESHGGRAWATDAPGGGAELHLELGPLDS
jgi:two-component system sensor histidine kinase MprB